MITGTTRCYPLVGHPVAQVRTPPAINNYFSESDIDAVMFAVDIEPWAVEGFFLAMRRWSNCGGCSVTVPHKQAAFRAMDRLSERARNARAVNIFRRDPDGALVGDMTDGVAFISALGQHGFSPAGKNVLLVGAAGGAGTAIAHAVLEEKPVALYLVDRNRPALTKMTSSLRYGSADVSVLEGWPVDAAPDLAINASPAGMYPDRSLPFDIERLPLGAFVADIVTKPNITPLLSAARARGHRICTGNEMADAQLEFQMRHLGLWRAA